METRTIVEIAGGVLVVILSGTVGHYFGFCSGVSCVQDLLEIPEEILVDALDGLIKNGVKK